eukprot:scaffold214284_cov22-Tisochrysis_lutea.AAC.1
MKMEQRAEERALRSREAAASSATTLSEGLGSKPLSAAPWYPACVLLLAFRPSSPGIRRSLTPM